MLAKLNLALFLAGSALCAAGCAGKPSPSAAKAPAPAGAMQLSLQVPDMNKRLKLF
jgi:hypothetical protein